MTTYIPYSTRHNITDPDLAWLLDYLERDMGWEIKYSERSLSSISDLVEKNINYKKWNIAIQEGFCWVRIRPYHDDCYYWSFHTDLFFATYRSLLPVIRDLYSK